MRRLPPIIVLFVVLAGAPIASAKGPSSADITGPGAAIRLSGDEGEPTRFWTVVEGLGFFPSVFGQQPDPMLRGRPGGDLGPRYTVRYTVPGPDGKSQIVQDLYPYAAGGPVTWMRSGQRVFTTQATVGGWFRGTDRAKAALVKSGLPATAPGANGRGFRWALPLAAIALIGVLTTLAVTRIRRRPEPRAA